MLGVPGDNDEVSQTRSGYRSSMRGLVGALIVSLGLMAGVGLMTFFQARETQDPVQPYDYTTDLATARAQAPFDVLAPRSLPEGWYATSARWSAAGPEKAWHLGLLTDQGRYVGLEQSNAVSTRFVAEQTKADEPGEPVQINGETWQTLTSGPETALVLTGDQVTTVVTGTASEPDLIAFAESLTTR